MIAQEFVDAVVRVKDDELIGALKIMRDKLNLVVEIKVYLNKEIKTTEFYDKSFYYNNIDSKFELSQYEETVLNNLLENISQEFLFKLQAL